MMFLQESGLKERRSRLLKMLRKFNIEFLRAMKSTTSHTHSFQIFQAKLPSLLFALNRIPAMIYAVHFLCSGCLSYTEVQRTLAQKI